MCYFHASKYLFFTDSSGGKSRKSLNTHTRTIIIMPFFVVYLYICFSAYLCRYSFLLFNFVNDLLFNKRKKKTHIQKGKKKHKEENERLNDFRKMNYTRHIRSIHCIRIVSF